MATLVCGDVYVSDICLWGDYPPSHMTLEQMFYLCMSQTCPLWVRHPLDLVDDGMVRWLLL